MKISVSTCNTKMGKVHNISLPPNRTCDGRPCAELCYAQKAYQSYPPTRRAWDRNFQSWERDPMAYFEQLVAHLASHNVRRFRWHVAGDIPHPAYYRGMCLVADIHPEVDFLAFTKDERSFRAPRPQNLNLVFSMWPGLLPDITLTRARSLADWKTELEAYGALAWMIPEPGLVPPDSEYQQACNMALGIEALQCQGRCDACFMCWYLRQEMAVAFHQH